MPNEKMKLNIVPNDTCFAAHERLNVECLNKKCRAWFQNSETLNCINIAAKKGPQKQEKIGEYFDLTRMRVCQIEKSIINRIKKEKDLSSLH